MFDLVILLEDQGKLSDSAGSPMTEQPFLENALLTPQGEGMAAKGDPPYKGRGPKHSPASLILPRHNRKGGHGEHQFQWSSSLQVF